MLLRDGVPQQAPDSPAELLAAHERGVYTTAAAVLHGLPGAAAVVDWPLHLERLAA